MNIRARDAGTLAAVLGCLLFAAGCDAWLTRPSLYSIVQVIVSDPTGKPVPDANVELYTGQRPMGYASTGADGRYAFERVPQGAYGVFLTRPVPYRDFVTPGDSAYAFQDGIGIVGGRPDTVRFVLSSCLGEVEALVLESTGAPVPGADVTLYTATSVLKTLPTDAKGVSQFTGVLCAYGLGLTIAPPAGYTIQQGRGSSYFDGFVLTNEARQSFTFELQKSN